MKTTNIFLALVIGLVCLAPVMAEVSLTVYQRDIVLVRDIRTVDLDKGENLVIFDNIAPGIYESTLLITPVTGTSGVNTIEQSYEYDLANQEQIWRKHIGKPFSFTKDDSLYEGKLLKLDDDYIYLEPTDQAGKIALVERSGIDDMTFEALPEGLVLHPEIHWRVAAHQKHSNLKVEISYLSDGITWQADYTALLAGDQKVRLTGNLTLANSLEMMFKNAQIDLIAGDLHRAYDNRQLSGTDVFDEGSAVEEDTRFFEYRRYKVPSTTTLHANQTKGLPLIGPVEVKGDQDFFFDGSAGTGEVMVRLRMKNDKGTGLGIGLPEGDLLVYQKDTDGKTQFLGEDHLEASAPGDEIELLVGQAFDVRADRRRVSHERIARNRTRDVVEIKFTSSRVKAANIVVRERLYGFWDITEATWNGAAVDHRVESANKVEFDLNLRPGTTATFRYVVEYGY